MEVVLERDTGRRPEGKHHGGRALSACASEGSEKTQDCDLRKPETGSERRIINSAYHAVLSGLQGKLQGPETIRGGGWLRGNRYRVASLGIHMC